VKRVAGALIRGAARAKTYDSPGLNAL
jgi:hypothetical protein